ncbi:hypothetical protein pclt_cds_1199 [Pandoravirus celtis]|uniref:Uncharacterized protein n=1 Tax=Pandoravirus celtis TaxID=2568002 RepID=A0A4D6EJ39_9VIRU|nr:hypothetical protein pclt_cds_1199 [Pandoravirus celtis]
MRHQRVDMASLPPEVMAAVVSWLGPRDHASAVLARAALASSRRGARPPALCTIRPKVSRAPGSLDGLCYWHGVDPWRIDIHCLRAAAEGGHRALVEWIWTSRPAAGAPPRPSVRPPGRPCRPHAVAH